MTCLGIHCCEVTELGFEPQRTLAWVRGGWHLTELTGPAGKRVTEGQDSILGDSVPWGVLPRGSAISILFVWFGDGWSWGHQAWVRWSRGEKAFQEAALGEERRGGRTDLCLVWSSASQFMLWNFPTP